MGVEQSSQYCSSSPDLEILVCERETETERSKRQIEERERETDTEAERQRQRQIDRDRERGRRRWMKGNSGGDRQLCSAPPNLSGQPQEWRVSQMIVSGARPAPALWSPLG